MEGWIWAIIVAGLVIALLAAFEFSRIAKMKGHNEKRYFWWCFLLGFVGWPMVIALPDRGNAATEMPIAEDDRLEMERKAEERRIAVEKSAKKCKKAFAIGTPIMCACIAFLIVLIKVIIPDIHYNAAVKLMDAGKYNEAITAFEAMDGYKDSEGKTSECLFLGQKSSLTNIKIGNIVKFGFYEQDNNIANGKEEIEWIVLNIEDNKALVVSKYALDCQQYNTSFAEVTWRNCSLRTWLNDSFLNAAFGTKHQELISSVSVSADKNPNFRTNPGNATNDKVFLLSITEAEKYLSFDSVRQCKPTEYAVANGAYINSDNSNFWWLRSPGYYQNYAAYVYDVAYVYDAAYVYDVSSVDYYGIDVDIAGVYVRPAMWINLDS